MRQLKIETSLTNRDSKSIKNYLSDVADIPLISAEEEVQLSKRVQKGDSLALEKLVKSNLRFVISVAKQFQNYGLSLEDLISEGNMGLIKAAKKFDHTKGFKFISYAVWWIRAFITKAIEEKGRIIRLPAHHLDKVREIKKYQNKQISETGYEFSLETTLENLEVNPKMKRSFLDSELLSKVQSLNLKLGEQDSSELTDVTPDKAIDSPEKRLFKKDLKGQIQKALKILDQKEKLVIEKLFNINTDRTYTKRDIAKELHISPSTVGLIKQRAMKKLAQINQLSQLNFD